MVKVKEHKGKKPHKHPHDKKMNEAKPDYIDLDKDGDKKESMKKAAKDAKKKTNEAIKKVEEEPNEGNEFSGALAQAKKSGKKFVIGDTGAGYAGKMLSMAAKKFGLKCKIFMGAKDIKRQQPNVKAMKKNGAEVVPVYSGSQTLVDAVSECMRYWVANCDKTHMINLFHKCP